jgi:hypothetical protein
VFSEYIRNISRYDIGFPLLLRLFTAVLPCLFVETALQLVRTHCHSRFSVLEVSANARFDAETYILASCPKLSLYELKLSLFPTARMFADLLMVLFFLYLGGLFFSRFLRFAGSTWNLENLTACDTLMKYF